MTTPAEFGELIIEHYEHSVRSDAEEVVPRLIADVMAYQHARGIDPVPWLGAAIRLFQQDRRSAPGATAVSASEAEVGQ